MKDEYKELSLWEALAVMQAQSPVITKTEKVDVTTKDGKKMNYNFAGLNTVWVAIGDLMEALGLVWSCSPDLLTIGGGEQRPETRLVMRWDLHHLPSGETRSGVWPLKGERTQDIGSSITYGRRYALVAVLNLRVAEDDDDAQAAEERSQLSPSQQAQAGRTPRKASAQKAPARTVQAPPPMPGGGDAAPRETLSQKVRGQFFAVLGELGLTDRDAIMAYVNETLAQHGHGPVKSRNELSDETAGWVIERAKRADAGPPEGEG